MENGISILPITGQTNTISSTVLSLGGGGGAGGDGVGTGVGGGVAMVGAAGGSGDGGVGLTTGGVGDGVTVGICGENAPSLAGGCGNTGPGAGVIVVLGSGAGVFRIVSILSFIFPVKNSIHADMPITATQTTSTT